MALTPQQITLVQQSFTRIHPLAKHIAEIFYTRLFALDPELRALFPDDMLAQQRKLIQMLAQIVDGLDQIDAVAPTLYALGQRHAGYGVRAAHYDTMREALLWMLERSLGDDFTPEARDAWSAAYRFMAEASIVGAQSAE